MPVGVVGFDEPPIVAFPPPPVRFPAAEEKECEDRWWGREEVEEDRGMMHDERKKRLRFLFGTDS